MSYVNWQYIVLDHGQYTGYRVARRRTQPFVPDAQGQDQTIGTPPGWNAHAPATLQHQGDTYNFAFWFLAGGVFGGQPLPPRVIGTPNFYDAVGEDSGTVATAYYMWNFGTGGGDNGAYLD